MSRWGFGDAPPADTLIKRIDQWKSKGPIHGVYWLAALDDEGPIASMDLSAWRESTRVRVKLLYSTMRALYDDAKVEEVNGPVFARL